MKKITGLGRSLAACLALVLAGAAVAGGGAAMEGDQELSDAQLSAIDTIVRGAREGVGFPSLIVLIDRGGKTIYSRALGNADLSFDIPASMETAYAIGSITKSFTGLAAVQLAYEGRLDLDATVSDYLPDYAGPGADVTVARLLDHTSGIPNYTNEIPGIRPSLERRAYTRDEMVALFEDLPLNFEPGTRWSYTNSGYYLLGLIIETVSGTDYYDYLRENVFAPLGMERTYSGDYAEVIPRHARGYAATGNGYVNAAPWHYLVPFSAGSLVSTAADVVRYRRGVFHSEHFPPGLRAMVLETRPLAGGQESLYSLGGLIISEFAGRRKISHAGDIWGYTSDHAYYPDDDLTIVMLANRQADAPAMSSFEQKIARVIFGVPQPEVQDLSLSEEELKRYAGDFRLNPYIVGADVYGFIERDGKLFIRFGGTGAEGPAIPLLAQGDGTFRAIFDDEWVFRFTGEPGAQKAGTLTMNYRGGTFYAERME
jgi:CubicO group peptidase (beta-lactamase class C family)